MTDPDTADRTYVCPMTPELLEPIIAKERPDAILPTMGGQTGLNTAKALDALGILKKYNVELLGAKLESIDLAEDRALFKDAMIEIGIESAQSGTATTMEEAFEVALTVRNDATLELVGCSSSLRVSFAFSFAFSHVSFLIPFFKSAPLKIASLKGAPSALLRLTCLVRSASSLSSSARPSLSVEPAVVWPTTWRSLSRS